MGLLESAAKGGVAALSIREIVGADDGLPVPVLSVECDAASASHNIVGSRSLAVGMLWMCTSLIWARNLLAVAGVTRILPGIFILLE